MYIGAADAVSALTSRVRWVDGSSRGPQKLFEEGSGDVFFGSLQ